MKEVHITIPSSTEFVGPVVNFFDALLVDTGLEKLAVSNVVTAVIEAVGNAIVHGNHSDKNKKVDIALKIHDNTLRLEVQDQGHGVNINELPDPLAPENLLKPCGRGIFSLRLLWIALRAIMMGTVRPLSWKKRLISPLNDITSRSIIVQSAPWPDHCSNQRLRQAYPQSCHVYQ